LLLKEVFFLSFIFLIIRAWWDQVTVKLDECKIIVLKRGISKGLNGIISLRGHDWPISILSANEEWKYTQKKEIKKKISEKYYNL